MKEKQPHPVVSFVKLEEFKQIVEKIRFAAEKEPWQKQAANHVQVHFKQGGILEFTGIPCARKSDAKTEKIYAAISEQRILCLSLSKDKLAHPVTLARQFKQSADPSISFYAMENLTRASFTWKPEDECLEGLLEHVVRKGIRKNTFKPMPPREAVFTYGIGEQGEFNLLNHGC